MSFRVTATFYIGEGWDEKDEQLYRSAGCKSLHSFTYPDSREKGKQVREHVWVVTVLEDAKNLRQRLIAAGVGAIVTFRET